MIGKETPILTVDIQSALEVVGTCEPDLEEPPSDSSITQWAQLAYATVRDQPSEVTIRLVNETEMEGLNQDYRGKQGATNVLSFSVELEPELQAEFDVVLLGDIVICHSVIIQEALEQHKSVENHYAHMVTHGILHLCGYDHEDVQSAKAMELLEINILEKHAILNPYIQ